MVLPLRALPDKYTGRIHSPACFLPLRPLVHALTPIRTHQTTRSTVTDVSMNGLGLVIAAVSVVTSGLQQIMCGAIQRRLGLTSNQLLSNTAPVQVGRAEKEGEEEREKWRGVAGKEGECVCVFRFDR